MVGLFFRGVPMKIEVKRGLMSLVGTFKEGDIVDIADVYDNNLIKAGYAVPYKETILVTKEVKDAKPSNSRRSKGTSKGRAQS